MNKEANRGIKSEKKNKILREDIHKPPHYWSFSDLLYQLYYTFYQDFSKEYLLFRRLYSIVKTKSQIDIVIAFSGGPDSSILLIMMLLLPLAPRLFSQERMDYTTTDSKNELDDREEKSLNQLLSKMIFRFRCIHVNHGLRDAAATEAEESMKNADRIIDEIFKVYSYLEIPHPDVMKNIVNIDEISKKNVQAWARERRYKALYCALFEDIQPYYGGIIATGHTCNDANETIMLNMLRGSGLDGMSGISYTSQLMYDCISDISNFTIDDARTSNDAQTSNDGLTSHNTDGENIPVTRNLNKKINLKNIDLESCMIMRPLLSIQKYDICNALKTSEIPYINDSSNMSNRYMRNRMRHTLENIGVEMEIDSGMLNNRIATMREHMIRAKSAIQEQLDRFMSIWSISYISDGKMHCCISGAKYMNEAEEIRLRVILSMIRNLKRRDGYKPRFRSLDAAHSTICENIQRCTIEMKMNEMRVYDGARKKFNKSRKKKLHCCQFDNIFIDVHCSGSDVWIHGYRRIIDCK